MNDNKCETCNGSGKKPAQSPYRIAAEKVKEVMKPVGNVFVRSAVKVKHWTYDKTLKKVVDWVKSKAFWFIAIVAVGFLLMFIHATIEEDTKERVVQLQFSDSGSVVRCWIGDGFSDIPHLKDHYVREVAHREKDVPHTLKRLGAKEDMECIDVIH